MIPVGRALPLDTLITPTEGGIASRVVAKAAGGTLTLFAFDARQGLSEHTSPFEAVVVVLEGRFTVMVGGTAVDAAAGALVGLPANVPHAVEAVEPSRMLLVLLRDAPAAAERP
jgi:quercetin dioxygenase-like cupin family protein